MNAHQIAWLAPPCLLLSACADAGQNADEAAAAKGAQAESTADGGSTTTMVPGDTKVVVSPAPTVTTTPTATVPDDVDEVRIGPDGASVDLGDRDTGATVKIGPTPQATIKID